MASEELFYATIRDIGARFRRRALSPVELTRAHLERIEQLDPKLHAFVTVTADRALADAKAAETALGRGDISSPLLGIPVGYKDIYATRGVLTTGGSALLKDWIPDEDDPAGVLGQRLRRIELLDLAGLHASPPSSSASRSGPVPAASRAAVARS